ncbi:MAG: hypothetical protein P8X91_00430, partial [Candidatus Bathyarchaeota archaeon]
IFENFPKIYTKEASCLTDDSTDKYIDKIVKRYYKLFGLPSQFKLVVVSFYYLVNVFICRMICQHEASLVYIFGKFSKILMLY